MFVQRIDTDPDLTDIPITTNTAHRQTCIPDPAAFYTVRSTTTPLEHIPLQQPHTYSTPQRTHLPFRDADCEDTPIRGAPGKSSEEPSERWNREIRPKPHEETSTCSSVPFETERKSYGPALDLSATILFSYQLAKIQTQNLIDGGAFVLLFVIPRRKRHGPLNTWWDVAELRSHDDAQTYRLDALGQDPHNLDQQFRLVLPNTSDNLISKFSMRCPSNGEYDCGPTGMYQVDPTISSVWTLRDGTLIDSDRANEIGILLEVDDDGSGRYPYLHYWDETDNVWHRRQFMNGFDRYGSRGQIVYLSNIKRLVFVIETSSGSFIKDTNGNDMLISWPGAYHISVDGFISPAELNILS